VDCNSPEGMISLRSARFFNKKSFSSRRFLKLLSEGEDNIITSIKLKL